MKKYAVRMAAVKWITVNVEAEDEESAIEEAYDEVPGASAHETGWGSFGRWSADVDEPVTVDEFYNGWVNCLGFDPAAHGPVVTVREEDDE